MPKSLIKINFYSSATSFRLKESHCVLFKRFLHAFNLVILDLVDLSHHVQLLPNINYHHDVSSDAVFAYFSTCQKGWLRKTYLYILYIYFTIIEINETKVTITLENIQEKKINTNIEDIFCWEATRNHRAFTLGLPWPRDR